MIMSDLNWNRFKSKNQLPPMTCQIVLSDNEPSSYTAGDTIRGHVHLDCSKSFFAYGVLVALEGTAIVKFRDGKVQSKSTSFMECSTEVYGNGERIPIPSGPHDFKFQLELSPITGELPGSFRSAYGFIFYQLVVYIKQGSENMKQADKVVNVSSYLNLSLQEPCLLTPIVYEKVAKLSSLTLPSLVYGIKSARPRLNFRMPKSGYLPGDMIHFDLDMDDPNVYGSFKASVTLVQKMCYSSGNCSKVKMAEMARIETVGLQGMLATWTGDVGIPAEGTLPNQQGLIERSYFLKVKVSTSIPDSSISMEVQVTIGSTLQ